MTESINLTVQINGWKRTKCVAGCNKFTKTDPDGFICRCGQRYLPDDAKPGYFYAVSV